MINLYYKPTCPFCQRVLGEVEAMGIKLNLKDISSDQALVDELIAKGGKKQVPFIEDTDKGVTMYESGDIIDYLGSLKDTGGSEGSFGGLRIHKSDEACESCQ